MKRKETKRAMQLRISHMSALSMINEDVINNQSKFEDLFSYLGKSAKMLCLYHASYTCESCSNKDDLTLHHMINKNNKQFMSRGKYLKQRLYYGNQVILCSKCHCDIEHRDLAKWKNHGVISAELIEKTKQEMEQ